MNRYEIRCTPEQTKKAREFGAPLEDIPMFRYGDNSLPKFVHKNRWNKEIFCYCPTAEQMRGWLMDKLKATTFVNRHYSCADEEGYGYLIIGAKCVLEVDASDNGKYLLNTDKEATLAAIDAALEYLTKNKK